MDVTRHPLPGMMPHLSHREPLRADASASLRATAATPTTVRGAGISAASAAVGMIEVNGPADGADIVLASGVRIRRKRVGGARVGNAELQQAIRGIQLLPLAHQQLLARAGVAIELVPVVRLENLPGKTDVVGATAIDGPDGSARPTNIRIAAFQAQLNSSVIEAVQHEVGHAIAVLANQDTSEATAERYARSY